MGKNYDLLRFEKLFKELDSTADRVVKLESYQNGLIHDCELLMDIYLKKYTDGWCIVESDEKTWGKVEGRLLRIGTNVHGGRHQASVDLVFYVAVDPSVIETISNLTEKGKKLLSRIQKLWKKYITDGLCSYEREEYEDLCNELYEEDNSIILEQMVVLYFENDDIDFLMDLLAEERQFKFLDSENPKGLNVFYKTRQELREHLTEGE